MKYSSTLKEFLKVVLQEAETNPLFRKKLESLFEPDHKIKPGKTNRRMSAVLDPLKQYEEDKTVLESKLNQLNIDQLKDIVSEYGMDPNKLVLKWNDTSKIIDHILKTTESRVKRGDAFRTVKINYNKAILEHELIYRMKKNEIEQEGIEQFLSKNGISIDIVPFHKHPDQGFALIGYHFDIKYRRNLSDEKSETLEYSGHKTYPSKEEASTQAILKSLEIIQKGYI